MKRIIFSIIFSILFNFYSESQLRISLRHNSKPTNFAYRTIGLNIGGLKNKNENIINAGIAYNHFDRTRKYAFFQPFLGYTLNYYKNFNNELIGYSVSARFSLFISMGIEYIYFSNNVTHANGFMPTIGLNLWGFDFRYGYANCLRSSRIKGLDKHLFFVSYFVPLYRNKKIKTGDFS